MPKRKQFYDDTPTTTAPGAFREDGSYWEQGELSSRCQVDGLVRTLVRERRTGVLDPVRAVLAVEAAGAAAAFPNLAQWRTCTEWYACWVATSAEETVKRAGMGYDGAVKRETAPGRANEAYPGWEVV